MSIAFLRTTCFRCGAVLLCFIEDKTCFIRFFHLLFLARTETFLITVKDVLILDEAIEVLIGKKRYNTVYHQFERGRKPQR